MITSSNKKSASNNSIFQSEWSFLSTGLSAMAGIGIGLLIGTYLGWI